MADHVTPSTPVSPKVLHGLLMGLLLTGLAAVLGAITPDMLTALGPWAGVVFTLITAALSAVTGYLKRDPLRDAGAASAPPAGVPEVPAPLG
jgi:hypothetical protein